MDSVSLVFPHQLFENNPSISIQRRVFLIEEYLFFDQYNFHKQKLIFHRASMKFYQDYLIDKGYSVDYIETRDERSDVRILIHWLAQRGVWQIHITEVSDDWLSKRIVRSSRSSNVKVHTHCTPMFLNQLPDLELYFKDKKRFFHHDFYIHQRKKWGILVDDSNMPLGGKWSYDMENRKKYPESKSPPAIGFPKTNAYVREAKMYVNEHYSSNVGDAETDFFYPVTFKDVTAWLNQFFEFRFWEFGDYEDAIVKDQLVLHHSVLSPLLNTGLITPREVLRTTLDFASTNTVPLNSLEGFIRQILGWREFIRAVYEIRGSEQRNSNFWGFERRIPDSFYDGTTGIDPIDGIIRKVLKNAYAHHIERLMLLGNFMLLCGFHPDEAYRWFMELFIDAYDWVMVPNVYGMSQFADGGLLATKPYISSSNYILKMSDFQKGPWKEVWDALFWHFMDKHRKVLVKNPRMNMLLRTWDKMSDDKRKQHLRTANQFLSKL